MVVPHYKDAGLYFLGSEPASSNRTQADRQRCCLIATVVIQSIIIVGAGIGLGLYFGGNILMPSWRAYSVGVGARARACVRVCVCVLADRVIKIVW